MSKRLERFMYAILFGMLLLGIIGVITWYAN